MRDVHLKDSAVYEMPANVVFALKICNLCLWAAFLYACYDLLMIVKMALVVCFGGYLVCVRHDAIGDDGGEGAGPGDFVVLGQAGESAAAAASGPGGESAASKAGKKKKQAPPSRVCLRLPCFA